MRRCGFGFALLLMSATPVPAQVQGGTVTSTAMDDPLNWQATPKDMISFLQFDGFKVKDGPSPGTTGILFDAPAATFSQDNEYTDFGLHGLWKVADDRVINSNMFASAKFACYGTGLVLNPVGGLDQQAGRSFTTAQLFNAFNRDTALVPNNNVLSPSFNTLAQNLSLRIFRVDLVVGF